MDGAINGRDFAPLHTMNHLHRALEIRKLLMLLEAATSRVRAQEFAEATPIVSEAVAEVSSSDVDAADRMILGKVLARMKLAITESTPDSHERRGFVAMVSALEHRLSV